VWTASCRNIENGDLGFHLAAGRLIHQQHAVPQVDDFSHTALGTRWIDFEWLYQWGTYICWRLDGPRAVVAEHALLNVLTFGVLAWLLYRRRGPPIEGLCALALAVLACELRFSVRPHAVGRLLLVVVLAGLLNWRRDRTAPLWPLVLVQMFWVNLHGSYLVALALAALLVVDERCERRPIGKPALLLAGLVLASLATPYGWRQTKSLLAHHAAVGSMATNPEWLPLKLSASLLTEPGMWALLALAVYVGVKLFVLRRDAGGWFERALWVTAVFAPFMHVRSVDASALVLVALLLPVSSAPQREGGMHVVLSWGVVFLVLASLEMAFVSNRYWRATGRTTRLGMGIGPMAPGYRAGEYLAQFPRLGRIFNGYASGGWLIWWLHPSGGRVFVDGRDVGNVYSPEILGSYVNILTDTAVFRETAAGYQWSALVLERGNPLGRGLIRRLQEDEAWRLVFLDDANAVYLPGTVVRSAPDERDDPSP